MITGGRPADLSFFADLGRRLESRWAACERDEEVFPALVADEFSRTPPSAHVDSGNLIRALLNPAAEAPRQLAPPGAFGQPGITLYHGRGFVVDVYFWNNAAPAIHNHPFAGVFSILKGFSLHRTYSFEDEETLGARARVGRMNSGDLTLLRESDMVAFSLRERPLVHSLVHVPNPSISLVARTVRTLEYFRYFPPSVALAMSEPDDWTARQLALLDMLRNADDPGHGSALQGFLAAADFETAFRAASAAYGHYHEAGREEELEAMPRGRHGARAELILPAIREAVRLQRDNAFREQFLGDGERFVASVLMCAENRGEVLRLLREGFAGSEPVEVLRSWVAGSGVFDPADTTWEPVLERLVAGQTFGAALTAAREGDLQGRDDRDPASVERGWRDSILRPLVV